MTRAATWEKPANFQFAKIDGIHLPFADNSLDFVFSGRLMEHLHPDDAVRQLSQLYRVLVPGGAYYCITTHAVTGPHDIRYTLTKLHVDST
ncbi:class I SAM-dependent methyltransferase [Mesorhizobium sp. M0159]|uniref:class I SAM-dependent methyltransferase n=1 Tax=unclassified Mesorhizobium TaxID=325217 RepID=UPI003338BA27